MDLALFCVCSCMLGTLPKHDIVLHVTGSTLVCSFEVLSLLQQLPRFVCAGSSLVTLVIIHRHCQGLYNAEHLSSALHICMLAGGMIVMPACAILCLLLQRPFLPTELGAYYGSCSSSK